MTRPVILRNIIFGLFALIAFDLFYLQVIRGGYFARLSLNNSLRVVSTDGPRGRIMDRNGRTLVESVKGFDVAVIPQDIKNKKSLFGFLAGVLGEDAVSLEQKFNRNKANPFAPVFLADGLTREEAIAVAEGSHLYPGLLVTERYRRRYPQGEIGSHIVGYVGKIDVEKMQELINNGISVPETVGYTGIEQALDEKLRGEPGGREVEVNSRGREVRVLSVREPVPGKDISISVDQRIQAAAYDMLAGRRGAFVMLDPSTGEVLSAVSSPAYDPNAFSDSERRRSASVYLSDTRAPMVNRSFGAAFAPGSVFKVPLAFAALEQNKIKPSTTFNCPGYFDLGGRRFNFSHAYGPQDLYQAMAHSANEYFFYLGFILGPDGIAASARSFGLGERTGVDLPGEAKGNIPSNFRKGWYKGDTANMSIGQGAVLSTPMQMARMMAAIENGGRILRPRFVKSIGGVDACGGFLGGSKDGNGSAPADKNARDQKHTSAPSFLLGSKFNAFGSFCSPVVRTINFRASTWEAIRASLRAVVKMPTGTAHELAIEGLEVYGKTGTAQTAPGKGDHAWFAGVVRGPKQTAAFCVFLEHGGSSQLAVQAAREMLVRLKEDGLI